MGSKINVHKLKNSKTKNNSNSNFRNLLSSVDVTSAIVVDFYLSKSESEFTKRLLNYPILTACACWVKACRPYTTGHFLPDYYSLTSPEPWRHIVCYCCHFIHIGRPLLLPPSGRWFAHFTYEADKRLIARVWWTQGEMLWKHSKLCSNQSTYWYFHTRDSYVNELPIWSRWLLGSPTESRHWECRVTWNVYLSLCLNKRIKILPL